MRFVVAAHGIIHHIILAKKKIGVIVSTCLANQLKRETCESPLRADQIQMV